MKYLAVAALIASAAHAQDAGPEFRQFQVATAFRLCIENTAQAVLADLKSRPKVATNAEMERIVWTSAFEACQPYITSDKARGTILLHYQGDTNKAQGFEEGLIWSGRSYVVSLVSESYVGTDAPKAPPKPARKAVPSM